ncbi:MAG: polyprenol monophosphomannose synthase [bacterium]|nr:polyprenol monophosphomannose synthase [bacterium]
MSTTRHWVIVPTYNEAENIADLIRKILAQGPSFYVLVADDNSPDHTADRAAQTGKSFGDRVVVLRRTRKEGYGKAVLAGCRRALALGADALFTMDADFSHDPNVLPRLALQLRFTDVAIGSRYVLGGRTENWPLYRRTLSAVANRLARAVTGLHAHDCTGGFRGYRTSVINKLLKQNVQSANYTFLVETLFLIERLGFTTGELPIVFKERERGQSKVNLSLIAHGALSLIRLGWRRISSEIVALPEPKQTRPL